MAAGCHIEIYKSLNNSWTVRSIFTKFGMELRLDTVQTQKGQKHNFSQSKTAADETLKFTKNFKTVRPIGAKDFSVYRPLCNFLVGLRKTV